MRLEDVTFLEVEDVERLHRSVIARFGGASGVRDRGILESAVLAPRSGYYASLAELAAVYIHGLAKNHAFVDGNKRAAFTAGFVFLEVNGYALTVGDEWVGHIESVASGAMSRDELVLKVSAAMGGDPVPVET